MHLWRGFTLKEIAQRLDPPRSEDWVSSRLAEVRHAIAEQVLETAGDELDAEVRRALERYVRT